MGNLENDIVKIVYANKKTERQCTSLKEATKLFGGNKAMALSLLSRVNSISQADVINDIRVNRSLRFHNLKGRYNGHFAIDVKSIKEKWRIILRPLDENENAFDPCHIDEIAMIVRIVEIKEVSAHYE